jgi:hypothetical protein
VNRPRPLHLLRDLFVYAPVGFLLEAPRLVPELVATGRERLTGCRRAPSEETRGATGRPSGSSRRDRGTTATSTPEPAVSANVEQAIPVEVLGPEDDGDEATMAIPSYDQLAASQVVARLAGLDAAELAQIEAYEQAHRARRTVLSRISQLRRT